MKKFKENSFHVIHEKMCNYIIKNYDFKCNSRTGEQLEIIGLSFELTNPLHNKIKKSDYVYANDFLKFMFSFEPYVEDFDNGKFIIKYPWTKKFTDKKSVPENYSTTYGPKIKKQLSNIINLLKKEPHTRRAILHILIPEDKLVLKIKTSHEYPCCSYCQFLIRNNKLHLFTQYRSNNIYSVLPYDVFLMTNLQKIVSNKIDIEMGSFFFNATSAHIFTKDLKININ